MAKGAASPTSAFRLAAAAKQAKALDLKKAGHTFAAIAQQLGYASESGARKAVTAALEKSIKQPAEEYRLLITARNEQLLSVVYPKAMKGDLDAIDTVRKLDQQTATINGLMSTKVKVGQDPEAEPVGVNAKMEVSLYNLLKRLTPEQRRLVNDLRERLVGPAGGSGEPSANGVGELSPAG